MQDQQIPAEQFPLLPPTPRGSSLRAVLFATLVAFLLGAGVVGWLAWRGDLAAYLPRQGKVTGVQPALAQAPTATPAVTAQALDTAEARVALLDERLSRIGLQADAASDNAARAEGLLIAFAARRAIDRGAALGYIENQLKLRFADAQPNAVRTIIEAAKKPVTVDELSGRLDAAASSLSAGPSEEDAWTRLRREVSSLFVIRRETTPSADPQDRLIRARLLLAAGKIDAAIAEVRRLPGADQAQDWIAAARRYAGVQHALDLIETTAMLEPRRLQDGEGRAVTQPSPLAPPAENAEAATGA